MLEIVWFPWWQFCARKCFCVINDRLTLLGRAGILVSRFRKWPQEPQMEMRIGLTKRWWLLRPLGSPTEDRLSVQVVGETHTSERGHDARHLINDLFLLSGGKPEPFQVG